MVGDVDTARKIAAGLPVANPWDRFEALYQRAFVDFIMAGIPPKPAAFEKIVAKNKGLVPLVSAKPRPFARTSSFVFFSHHVVPAR